MHVPSAFTPAIAAALRAPERLAAIADLSLVGPSALPVSPDFPPLLRDTAAMMGVAGALVSVILGDVQHTLASHGLDRYRSVLDPLPVEWAPCSHVVADGKPWAVEDTFLDPRTIDNPLVTEHGVRAYIGVPLQTRGGEVVGALCAVGDAPARFTAGHVAALRLVAAEIMRHLEARRDFAALRAPALGEASSN